MIRVTDIVLPLDCREADFLPAVRKATGIKGISSVKIAKRSVDARQKNNIRFLFSFDITVEGDEEKAMASSKYPHVSLTRDDRFLPVPCGVRTPRSVVVGAGPAGMMAAWALAKAGMRPVVFERGADVRRRKADVEKFWQTGALDVRSNVQFGEGGAGAFSDGKLTTGIKKDAYVRTLLDVFVGAGAPPEILWQAKPHVGTDNLYRVVQNIRAEIIKAGGEYRFDSRVTDVVVKNGVLKGMVVETPDGIDEITADAAVFAVGHSARDTFEMLQAKGVAMAPKAFAVGVRIEHPQALINASLYGRKTPPFPLGAADYKLAIHLPDGRSAYTFCMCPGGYVVAAASETGRVVTNGMSYFKRDGMNANSAFLVGVTPADFGGDDVLAGVRFQRDMETAAFNAGGRTYAAPAQRVEDFLKGSETTAFGDVLPTYRPAPVPADLTACLPAFVAKTLRAALPLAERKLKGFCFPDAVMTGVETRSSSPVRLLRDDKTMESLNVAGLYPCGEGAGYAGGIVSAGVDGLKCAERIIDEKIVLNG